MIKLLATAAIGLTMMSGAASADVSHCGMNESRMNPTELSAYQECWLDVYKTDVNYGKLGSLFWVRANGEYYSTQLNMLRNTQYRDIFLADIEEDIKIEFEETVNETAHVVETITEYVEVIVEIDAGEYTDDEYRDLLKKSIKLEMDLEAALVPDTYTATIKGNTYNIDSVADLETAINAEKGKSYKKGFSAGVKSVNIPENYIEKGDTYNATEQGNTLSDTTGVVVEGLGSGDVSIYGLDAFGIYDEDTFTSIEAAIEAAVDAAHDKGYSDGYANGYAAGYADGLADGMAS